MLFCVIWVICLYMPIICYWTLTSFRGIRLVTVAWAWYFTRNGDETNQNPWYPAISWMSGAEKRFGLGRVVWLFRLPSDCRLADLGRSWQLPRMEIPMKQAPNYRYYRLLIWWNLHAVLVAIEDDRAYDSGASELQAAVNSIPALLGMGCCK